LSVPVFKEADVTNSERRRVAIVDDDHGVRESLRFLLEVAGHSVETFASAADFLAFEIKHLSCLILDHHMPPMNGLELAERLRAGGSVIPILLITGLPSPSMVARAAALGIARVLAKPFDDTELLEFVKTHRS
jgi:FixJ family two-component response regulator